MVDKSKQSIKTENKTAQKQENNNAVSDKKIADLEKNKKINSQKTTKAAHNNATFAVLSIVVLLIVAAFFFFKNDIAKLIPNFSLQNKNNVEHTEESYIDFQAEREFNIKNFQKISGNLKTLEKEIEHNSEYIKSLQSKIDELEEKIREININPQRIELVRTAINIQNDIRDNKNYSAQLETLKILSKDDVELNKNIEILVQNQNNIPTTSMIKKTFDEELKVFLKDNNVLRKNDGNFSKFLSNFITIRRLDNVEENSTDFFIVSLEKSIHEQNYIVAINILNDNPELQKYFAKTFNNIKTRLLVCEATKEIINYLINK